MKRIHINLSDSELFNLTTLAAKKEKEATLLLLDYLLEVDERKLYATKAYSSLFEYIVKDLGLSEPAASERVNTVRLMKAVPIVKTHLKEGRLSLTTASQIERFIKIENKVRKKSDSVPTSEKSVIIDACLNLSKREVEKKLFQNHSEEAKVLTQEKTRRIDLNRTELRLSIDDETLQKLNELNEMLGERSLEFIFDQAIDALIAKEQKARGRETRPAEFGLGTAPTATDAVTSRQSFPTNLANTVNNLHSRFIPIELKRALFQRSGGQCEYIDAKTKIRCRCRYRIQIDHIYPFALGGKTEFENLRHLCQAHNLHAAKGWGLSQDKSLH